jgi:hypothetical protein
MGLLEREGFELDCHLSEIGTVKVEAEEWN